MSRAAMKGAPTEDLEAQVMAGEGDSPVNPETGEETPENGKARTDPQERERLKGTFVSAQFPGGPKLEDFEGVREPTKEERETALSFRRFKEGRAKQAESVKAKPGERVIVTKAGAIQVRDAKGRIARSVASGFRDAKGRFGVPPSPSVKIEDRDAFNKSVRDKAESEGRSFFRGESPSTRQTDLFQDAIFDALGV